ncbi:MAG: tyrosine-protein phosphatase [Acidobacteriota bacterium]|nr:tyrosine-protein phosphatase [Acidobacteriota bacterium]
MFEICGKWLLVGLFLPIALMPAACTAKKTAHVEVGQQTGADDSQRQVKLDGQDNFRDLGGYRTADGRHVKWGQVYRAGQLSKLSDADVARLEKLGVRTVIDFRGEDELESRGLDRLPRGVRFLHQPIGLGSLLRVERQAAASPGGGDAAPGAVSMQLMAERIMLEHTGEYATLVRELAAAQNRPLVFHCTAGKDRTGVGGAVVLTLLGVPWETVREDYLLSNFYRREENRRDLENLRANIAKGRGVAPEEVDVKPYERMYLVDGAYIDAARAAAVERYGSMENYIREGLDIDDGTVARLRAELLEP